MTRLFALAAALPLVLAATTPDPLSPEALSADVKVLASDAFGGPRKSATFREDAKRFFVNYFKQVSVVFGAAAIFLIRVFRNRSGGHSFRFSGFKPPR